MPKKRGRTLVLLHGGLSDSASMMRAVGPYLKDQFVLAAFDRRGHGRTADTNEPFSYDAMADEAIAFIEELDRAVYLLGHSDGGNVALLVAKRRPDLVRRAVVVGANFHYDGLVPLVDFTPESEGFAEFAVDFAQHSPDGIEHASAVVQKSLELVKTQPTMSVDDLRAIVVPVLVMSGDDDVAQLTHTVAMFEAIPEAQLAVIPGASHAVLKEQPKVCVRMIERFLVGPVPPETRAPLRRAQPDAKPRDSWPDPDPSVHLT